MMRRLAILLLLVACSLSAGCRSGRPNAGWDAYVAQLYRETKVALQLTERGTEASLLKAIRVYTSSLSKADALIRRAGTNAYAVAALKKFKATAYLGRSIAQWDIAEARVIANGDSASAIQSMIGDATSSIDLLGELKLDKDLVQLRGSGRSIRGRGHVLHAVATEFANLGDSTQKIIADGSGTILDWPRQWDGYALKAWGHLAAGNPDGLAFAEQAVKLEPNLPKEVLTVTLAGLVEEYTKGGGAAAGGGDGSSRRLRSVPDPAELAAARQAARKAVEGATPGSGAAPALDELRKQFPAD